MKPKSAADERKCFLLSNAPRPDGKPFSFRPEPRNARRGDSALSLDLRVAKIVKFGAHTDAVFFEPVDHAAIARACGCHGRGIDKAEDFLPAVREALSSDRLTLLDVVTDPKSRPPITFYEGHF